MFARLSSLAVAAFGVCALMTSCASNPAPCPETQSAIETIAKQHPNVTRLSVHAIPPGSSDYCAIASTSAAKRGSKSDPEDIESIKNGAVVVKDEAGGFDVTVPILMKDGGYSASAGVTVKSGVEKDAAVAEAKTVAAEVAAAMESSASKK